MKVKVCGMREPDNIRDLAELSPDFMGFIFYGPSPRNVEKPEAAEALPSNSSIRRVGVFVNADLDFILEKVDQFHLHFAQLHGDESPGFCAAVAGFVPVIKAFRIDDAFDFDTVRAYDAVSDLFVFDARGKSYGGNGHTFNWEVLDQYQGATPFLLSGGIGPDHAEVLGEFAHPRFAGVDLNSRFERPDHTKNTDLLQQFIHQITPETAAQS